MTRNMSFLASLLVAAAIIFPVMSIASSSSFSSAVYAQDAGMVQTTSGGSLDVRLEPVWSEGAEAMFDVSFLDPETGTLHEHQDYDFRILRDDGEIIYSAANQTGQPLLHNVPGTLSVPYTFEETGEFVIQVHLAGIGLPAVPTNEEASFPITVVPEFPGVILTVAIAGLMMTSAIILSQRLKLF
jgi:hypothetical protein